MSNLSEKSIRVVTFSGKKKDWRMWSRQFLAIAGKREYKDVLTGKMKVPAKTDVLDPTKDADKKKLKARKANDSAYHDLVLANQTAVAFNLIDNAVSTDLPDGDAAKAWKALNKKFDSTSSSTLVSLSELFHSSALTDIWTDPEEWIVELEIL